MSTITAARRIALLSSSSLGLAAIVSAASLGLALTPTAAAAQATCTSGTAVTGNGTNTVTIAGGTNNPGITCAYTGTGAGVSTTGATTVSTVAPGGGINLTATGANAINWTSTAGTVTGGAQVNGPLIEALSQTGAITLTTAGVTATAATNTRAIRAQATGAGAVTINTRGEISATNAAAGSTIAIEALSGGGDVAVTHTVTSSADVTGRLYGVYARTSGAGNVDIDLIGGNGTTPVAATSSLAGGAGVYAETGTGTVTINGRGQSSSGAGVLINSGGDINFTGSAGGSIGGTMAGTYGIDIVNVAAGKTAIVNLAGGRRAIQSGNLSNVTTGTLAAIRAAGQGDLLVNILGIQGAMNFDFTGMSAPVDVVVKAGAAWAPAHNASTTIPNGNFSIDIEPGALLIAGAEASGANTLEAATVLTFTDPAMVLNNAGYIVVGPGRTDNSGFQGTLESELRIVGLGEFRHSGTILLGSIGANGNSLPGNQQIHGVNILTSDGAYDDMLVFQNGTWIGEGGKIVFDVDTTRTQTNCTREAVTNNFSAADCVRIINSTVEGVTYVGVVETLAGDRGRLTQSLRDDGILLIDAPGSTVDATNFLVDPTTKGYNADTGSIDKGLYQYALLFDPDASQFKLFGTLSGAAYQLPIAATAAHNLWRVSTGSWLERQADLRGGAQPGIGGGVWLRAQGERTDRDIVDTAVLGGLPFSTDSTYTGDTYAITGGVDLISAAEGDTAYVFGFTAGYGHTDVEYAASPNTQSMDAWSGGLYASLVSGPLFVDAVVNANNVIIDTDAPGFQFLPEGTILSSRMISIGGQVEAGYRFDLGQGLFAEPLASVSYVRSKMEELDIKPDDLSRPGLEVSFEDPSSLRAGVGGRLGLDSEVGPVRTQISMLGRVWNDLEGQNTASIHNLAFPDDPEIRVVDDFSGMFSEFSVGAGLYSLNGLVSGFVNVGAKFGEDYEAKTGSIGVRVAW